MEGQDSFFGLIQLAIGAYLIYCGVTGRGQLYSAQNIKKGKEAQYRKSMRLLAFLLGPVMLACGIVDYTLSAREGFRYLSGALWMVSFALVVVMFVVAFRLTDRAKKPAKPGVPGQAPRAAFYFDEDTKDD